MPLKIYKYFFANKHLLERVSSANEIMCKQDEIRKILIPKKIQPEILNSRGVAIKGAEVDINVSEFDQKLVFVVSC